MYPSCEASAGKSTLTTSRDPWWTRPQPISIASGSAWETARLHDNGALRAESGSLMSRERSVSPPTHATENGRDALELAVAVSRPMRNGAGFAARLDRLAFWVRQFPWRPPCWSFALTEPGAVSDPRAIQTTARRGGYRYVINGPRHFISNGSKADLIYVIAKTEAGARTGGMSIFTQDLAAGDRKPGHGYVPPIVG